MSRPDPHGTNKIMDHVMEWSQRPEWSSLLDDVLEEHTGAAMAEHDIESYGALGERIGVDLLSRHGFACAFEDFLGRENDEGTTIVEEYLRRRSFRETVPAKRYLRELGNSVISLYEVIESVPGNHLILRDRLRGGEPLRTEERSGSKSLVKWDLLATRVIRHNNVLVLAGGIQLFEPETADYLEQEISELAETAAEKMIASITTTGSTDKAEEPSPPEDSDDGLPGPTEEEVEELLVDIERDFAARGLHMPDLDDVTEPDAALLRPLCLDLVLAGSAPTFTYYWLTQALRQANAPPPKLVNTDGDEMIFVETRWPIIGDVDRIVRGLDRMESDSFVRVDTDEVQWGWLGAAPPAAGSQRATTPDALTLRSEFVDDPLNRVSLGTVALEGDTLLLSANSENRAERGRKMIEGWLAGLLGTPSITRQEMSDLREESRASTTTDSPSTSDIPPELQAEIIGEVFERHYRNWIDAPLPALGGRTPREAAASGEDVATLVQILKGAENIEARRARKGGLPPYDLAWLWRELGVTPDAA